MVSLKRNVIKKKSKMKSWSSSLVFHEVNRNSNIALQLETFGMQESPCVRGMPSHLLYVFRMMSKMARMIIMPMTMTAIIAPEPERHRREERWALWQLVYELRRLIHISPSCDGPTYFVCPPEIMTCDLATISLKGKQTTVNIFYQILVCQAHKKCAD